MHATRQAFRAPLRAARVQYRAMEVFRNICVAAVAMLMISSAIRYIWQIIRGTVEPATSTWIIFLSGTALSFTTYMLAEDRDMASGILNTMDVMEVGSILTAVLIFGHARGVRFSRFERWYLVGIAVIIAYGLIFGDAWGSNLFVQALIALGYVPTVHKIISLKRNTESFMAWSFSFFAGVFALLPAILDRNTLAIVYASRTVVMVGLFLGLMAWYQFGGFKTREEPGHSPR